MARAAAQKVDQSIRDGMARALWVHAFMIWATEVEPGPMFSGGTWEDMAPDSAATRQASGEAADALVELLVAANQAPMSTLIAGAGRRTTPRDLGGELALLCLGVRDIEDSAFRQSALILPRFQIELDDDGDSLTWDGGMNWTGNPESGTGTMVLLIEDDPVLQRATTRMIRKIYPDARVVVADNADSAIADLQVHDFVLVVSDYDLLGDKTGGDVFRWVQANQPQLVDHYVFFTGNDAPESMHYRYVQKPADVAELKHGITKPVPESVSDLTRRNPPRTSAPIAVGKPGKGAFKSSVPTPSRVEVVRVGRPSAGTMEVRAADGTITPLAKDEVRAWVDAQMPEGYSIGALLDTHRDFSIEHGIPSGHDAVAPNALYITRPSELAEHGIQGNEIHPEHAAELAKPLHSKLRPIDIKVTPDGKFWVEDGNHRLQRAAADDSPMAVQFRPVGDDWEPQSGSRDISERLRTGRSRGHLPLRSRS